MTIAVDWLCPLLQVYDMPEAVAFYRDILGFEIVQSSDEIEAAEGRYFHWVWLRHGEHVNLMLNTAYDSNERPAAREPARQRAHSDVTIYLGCKDADAMHAAVTAKGLAIDPPKIVSYGMKQLTLSDPDGYAICFQHPA